MERITKDQYTILFINKWQTILEQLTGDAPERGSHLEQLRAGQETDLFNKPRNTVSLNYVQALF